MSEIILPFKPYFREPLLNGTKIFTARTKRMGKYTDTFQAFGQTFTLVDITEMPLENVADFWESEGCKSREHFIEVWCEIHPIKGYDPKQMVYLHQFMKVVDAHPNE